MYYMCLLSLLANGSRFVAFDVVKITISRAKQSASNVQVSL
jgi:hypothetical protein